MEIGNFQEFRVPRIHEYPIRVVKSELSFYRKVSDLNLHGFFLSLTGCLSALNKKLKSKQTINRNEIGKERAL